MTSHLYVREEPAGFLENAGVEYYRQLEKSRKREPHGSARIDDLPPDPVLQSRTDCIAGFASGIAFIIGAATSAVAVGFSYRYADTVDGGAFYSMLVLITLVSSLIEFVALFWLSLKTVHLISNITHSQLAEYDPYIPGEDAVPNLLARAALELPDPVVRYLGIDPMKYISKPKMLLVGLLYKAKVMLTSVAAKFLVQRLGGKLVSRVGLAWVSIPIAALWNARVMYQVAREARLRLFGHRLAYYLITEVMTDQYMARLSPLAREGAIRAISTMMVMTQNYHPNMLILLFQFGLNLQAQDQNDYDDWSVFIDLLNRVKPEERFFLLDLLSVAAAFDGHVSNLQMQQLPMAFGEYTDQYLNRIKRLKGYLLTGQFHAAMQACQLDFQPG